MTTHVDHLDWSIDFDIDFDGYVLFQHHAGPTYRGYITEHQIPADVVRSMMVELLRLRRLREINRMTRSDFGLG